MCKITNEQHLPLKLYLGATTVIEYNFPRQVQFQTIISKTTEWTETAHTHTVIDILEHTIPAARSWKNFRGGMLLTTVSLPQTPCISTGTSLVAVNVESILKCLGKSKSHFGNENFVKTFSGSCKSQRYIEMF